MTQFSFLCELLTYLWKSFLSRITVSHLVQSYGWWETGEGDMIYVCRVKAIWFIMSAVMLVLRFLLPAVICISELWHDSSLREIQLSAQQSRHPITNTVCHTERGKVQKRWGEEMKESKKKEWQKVRHCRDWERWSREISQHSQILCRYFSW